MRKILVLLLLFVIVVFAFVSLAQAEYVTQKVTVSFDSSTHTATATLDLSNPDWQEYLGGLEFLYADVKLQTDVISSFGMTRRTTSAETRDLGGTYYGSITSNLIVKDTSTSDQIAAATVLSAESYTIPNGTYLNSGGDETALVESSTTISNTWTIDLLPYLGADGKIMFDFSVFAGGNSVSGIPAGYRGGIEHIYYDVATISATFEVPDKGDVTPEPATMLIFGAGIAGLGLVRMRKRQSIKQQ